MGYRACEGAHDYGVTKLGAGMARLECHRCQAVMIDLAAEDGSALVTAPGLFGPAKPTIFSVLAEEERAMEKTEEAPTQPRSVVHRPAFAFGGPTRRR